MVVGMHRAGADEVDAGAQGPSLVEWMPDVSLDAHLPARLIPRSRPYSNIVFDASTSLIVAASSLMNRFTSYDEDGNIVWEPDSAYIRRTLSCLRAANESRSHRRPKHLSPLLRDLNARAYLA